MNVEMQMVLVESINFDLAYQRPLDERRAAGLAKAFASGAMKAVSLSRRPDGSLWCYDGQHTIEIARLAGIMMVPAVIVPGSQTQEAEWFLAINGGAKRVTQRDRQKAGVVAHERAAVLAERLLETYGLQIANGGMTARKTNAIGAIRRYALIDLDRLDRAMQCIDWLWRDEVEAWSGLMIRCMFEAVGCTDRTKLERHVKAHRVTPRRVLDTAAAMQSATGSSGGGGAYVLKALLTLCKLT